MGPFPASNSVHGVTYDGQHVWFASGDKLNAFDPGEREDVRSIDVAAHAGTAFDGQHLFQLAERPHPEDRPEDRPRARHDPGARRRRTRGWPGPKGRSGSGSIGTGRSIRSIPRPGRSFAPSNPTASSPASPGSTASSGTPPGKATRAICGGSIRERERFWRSSRCRPAWACRGSSPTAATGSSAAAEAAAR